jgi:hypothetical protein
MTLDYWIVNAGEAKTLLWNDAAPSLATFDLGNEFAVTAFNPATKTIGLARNIDGDRLSRFLQSLLSPDMTLLYPVLQVRIVGGGSGPAYETRLKDVLMAIRHADSGRNFIDIVSASTAEKSYPQSFKLTPLDGEIEAIHPA